MLGVPLRARPRFPRGGGSSRARTKWSILRYRVWEERFSKDPDIIGRQIRVDGKQRTVVGVVAPYPSEYREPPSLVLPLAFTPDQLNHDFHWLLVMGRLKPGVTMAQANANMEAVTKQIAAVYPKSNTGWSASVEPLQHNFLPRETRSSLWLLLGAVGFVLLIACVNVANLMLARGSARQRELAVRASIGASRGRLFRQLLVGEPRRSRSSAVLLGVALSSVILARDRRHHAAGHAALRGGPDAEPAGAARSRCWSRRCPACSSAARRRGRRRARSVNDILKDGGTLGDRRRTPGSAARSSSREFALALSLLAGGGLAVHSLVKLTQRRSRLPHGSSHCVPAAGSGRTDRGGGADQRVSQPAARPNRRGARRSRRCPLRPACRSEARPSACRSRSSGSPWTIPRSVLAPASTWCRRAYFGTFGIQIIRGRTFTDQDRLGTQPVAIVNETFAKRYFRDVDPLTQRIVVEQLIPGATRLGPPIEWQIVGVHRDIKNGGPRNDGFPEIDVPLLQSPWPGVTIAVRTAGDVPGLERSLAAAIRTVDPDLPIVGLRTMEQIVRESISAIGSGPCSSAASARSACCSRRLASTA